MHSYSYPGHIHKARRQFRDILKDKKTFHFIFETRDARIQHLDHPDLNNMGIHIAKRIIFNKLDLLNTNAQQQLFAKYPESFYFSNRNKQIGHSIRDMVDWILDNAIDTYQHQLVHIVGYPNTGKSTLVNQFRNYSLGKSGLKTGNIAGITKKIEKVKFLESPKIDLVDFPGVLVPTKEIEFEVAIQLSIIGCCKFDNVDPFLEAHYLICYLKDFEPSALQTLRIGTELDFSDGELLIEHVGRAFNINKKGNKVDLEKTARFIIQRYKDGKISSNAFV